MCGVVFFVVAYKLYAWWYRRSRGEDLSNPYPETRQPLAGQNSGSVMTVAYGSPPTPMEGGFGSVWHGRSRSSMAFGDMHAQDRSPYESSPQFSPQFSGGSASNTPTSPKGGASISREPSPFGLDRAPRTRNDSVASAGWGGSTGEMASASSRGSLAAVQRRSAYGSSTYNGPQLRSPGSSNRLSGAPHAAHSRIDIVPPLPLGPPPGTVVATDKSTLDFLPLSGVGNGRGMGDEWITNARGEPERSLGFRNPAFDGEYARSTSTPSSSGHSFPPSQRGRDTRAPAHPTHSSPTQSGSPPRSYPSSDSSPSSSSSVLPRPTLPALNTHLNPSGYPALHALPTSPLEKLQQRMAQEAHREQKAQDRRERVRRANGGEDGTFEGSSGSGSTGEKVDEVGGYRAPSVQLEELVSKR